MGIPASAGACCALDGRNIASGQERIDRFLPAKGLVSDDFGRANIGSGSSATVREPYGILLSGRVVIWSRQRFDLRRPRLTRPRDGKGRAFQSSPRGHSSNLSLDNGQIGCGDLSARDPQPAIQAFRGQATLLPHFWRRW